MSEPRQPHARILVVEDFFLVAQVCKAVLEKEGCTVVGPAGTVARAMALLASEDPPVDGAVLDLTLHGEPVTPVAERLQALGRPFVFLTAATDLGILPKALRGIPRVEKPMRASDLIEALSQVGLCPMAPARPASPMAT